MNNEIELAWAAGFFDGEGTTSSSKSNGANVRLSITQYHPEVLERFVSAIGFGKVYGPSVSKSGKDFWQICLSSKPTIVALGRMWPYLGNEKKNQALKALHKYSVQRNNTNHKSGTMDTEDDEGGGDV